MRLGVWVCHLGYEGLLRDKVRKKHVVDRISTKIVGMKEIIYFIYCLLGLIQK